MASESEQIVGLYERLALEWAGDRGRPGRFIEKDWLDRFTATIPAGGTILDLGCGFGKPMAAYLLTRGFKVCGVDSSPTMISMCRQEFPAGEWLVADMRALDLRRRFAGIMAWDSFFHLSFDDQRNMFPVFAALAAPGAPLLFTSGPRHGEAIGELRGEALYHASLDPEEYSDLLAANGFVVVDEKMEDPDCGGHSVWLTRRAATLD
ncbi:MAG: methyltransferase domain-containing protein [Pseudolabrys sp.]|nr:methyltransferase domain-containing protein [Pseudolabrys sp.]